MTQQKKILIVDDDPSIVEALSIMLEEEGYAILSTTDANTLTPLLALKPDVLLLDIRMSGCNGEDICKELKSQDQTKQLPIIMISANRDTKTIAQQAGANAFITKPFELQQVLDTVAYYTTPVA